MKLKKILGLTAALGVATISLASCGGVKKVTPSSSNEIIDTTTPSSLPEENPSSSEIVSSELKVDSFAAVTYYTAKMQIDKNNKTKTLGMNDDEPVSTSNENSETIIPEYKDPMNGTYGNFIVDDYGNLSYENGSIAYNVKNTVFSYNAFYTFSFELTDENTVLAQNIGTGNIDVVLAKSSNGEESVIVFKNGDKFYACAENGWGRSEDNKTQYFDMSTHKQYRGYYMFKDFFQTNERYKIILEGNTVKSIEFSGGAKDFPQFVSGDTYTVSEDKTDYITNISVTINWETCESEISEYIEEAKEVSEIEIISEIA